MRFLTVGVPDLCFVIAGALNDEHPLIALGGILVIDSVYGLSRKHGVMVGNIDQKRQHRSFALAGVIDNRLGKGGLKEFAGALIGAGKCVSPFTISVFGPLRHPLLWEVSCPEAI
jgi:hypothetical protein